MYERFAQLLKENNVSAYKVSKETGIATSTLSDWKNGRSNPKLDKLQKIADYFNVSTEYLVGEEPVSEPETPTEIVNKIKALCDQKDVTITELERLVGIGRSTIRNWDKSSPTTDKLQKVADYFNVSVDYLLGREEKQDELLFLRGGDKLTKEEREELKKILQMSADVYLRAKGLID